MRLGMRGSRARSLLARVGPYWRTLVLVLVKIHGAIATCNGLGGLLGALQSAAGSYTPGEYRTKTRQGRPHSARSRDPSKQRAAPS